MGLRPVLYHRSARIGNPLKDDCANPVPCVMMSKEDPAFEKGSDSDGAIHPQGKAEQESKEEAGGEEEDHLDLLPRDQKGRE